METVGTVGVEGKFGKEEAHVSNEEVQGSKAALTKEIARSVLRAFGLRPFHVFDGERYHVCFGVANEKIEELNFNKEHLDEFFSNCSWPPTSTSDALEEPSPVLDVSVAHLLAPAEAVAAEEEEENQQIRENDCVSGIPASPKEVYYIMEEYYPSPSPPKEEGKTDRIVDEDEKIDRVVAEDQQVAPVVPPHPIKELYFVMEDNYLSPEELRLQTFYPSLLCPPSPPQDAPLEDGHSPCHAEDLDVHDSGAKIVDASTRSNAGKVSDGKYLRAKKKIARAVEDCDASQSVRLDKANAVTTVPRTRRRGPKIQSTEPPEEPPWNGMDVGDLEEQTGDSWVEDEILRGLPEEKPSDVVNPGKMKKTFWPTPLYGSPGRQVVKSTTPERASPGSDFVGSEEESSEVEDFEECLEESRKKEEVARAKYALLFKDDQSWRKKFLDGLKLTCDICFSKRKVKKFSSVMSLLAHAKTVKKLRQPEHRGYAQAIRNLLHLDQPESFPGCHSAAGDCSYQVEGVWPPVLVLENTVLGVDFDGQFVCLSTDELAQMLKALGDQGARKLRPVVGETGLTGQVLVEFPTSHRGWIDAKHLHQQFELRARSYEEWLRLKPKFKGLLCDTAEVQESNGLVMVFEDGHTMKRILYGYLATPRIITHIDPNKLYVDWEVGNLKDFFDLADSECS